MSSRYFGGLQGQERYLHHRQRDERRFHGHLLREYFEPERANGSVSRHIPIRHRAAFVPATVSMSNAADPRFSRSRPADSQGQEQLTLPLGGSHTAELVHQIERAAAPVSIQGKSRATPARQRVLAFGNGVERVREWANKYVEQRRRRNRATTASLPLKPPEVFARRRPPFTWQGFLSGCAMGGMAAMFTLFVLHTLTG